MNGYNKSVWGLLFIAEDITGIAAMKKTTGKNNITISNSAFPNEVVTTPNCKI